VILEREEKKGEKKKKKKGGGKKKKKRRNPDSVSLIVGNVQRRAKCHFLSAGQGDRGREEKGKDREERRGGPDSILYLAAKNGYEQI